MKTRTCQELGVCQGRAGCSCTRHDTERLPPGGYYFAPGAIEHGKRRVSRRLTRQMIDWISLLAVAVVIGSAAGYVQVRGWPL
ncbi:hypothetical protein ACDW_22900 [Acidovorax sp. DW039]|uniref:hypothetical protein n=1 Tax=Acidovorax sp. DW039 TaxID=3095606 RepID=UPI003088934A|nr:hypothetical protein ACDW_22900 [Acidovorax sp. DW039]